VSEFGPIKLPTLREGLIGGGLSRSTINNRVARIRQLFKWGTSEELVPNEVYQKLAALAGLQKGRSEAYELEPISPVPPDHVTAIEPFVTPQIWGLVQLQLATGARSGDLVIMRQCDIECGDDVWVYRPDFHKTQHHGPDRCIFIGPRGQEVLRPFLLGKAPKDYVFSPKEAVEHVLAERKRRRKTPLSCGNIPGSARRGNPKKKPGEHYTPLSYGGAVARACRKAGVPPWSPHRLRHSTATEIRRRYNVEASRVVCGHQSLSSTEIYAERDLRLARQVMAEIG
jgi:integrase